jgi:hypothetical protein
MDQDLEALGREELIAEVRRLRHGIRRHRDSSGHHLCWRHPELWGQLPERIEPEVAVPPWPKFLRGCVTYRESLDAERPDAVASADAAPGYSARHRITSSAIESGGGAVASAGAAPGSARGQITSSAIERWRSRGERGRGARLLRAPSDHEFRN